MEGVYFTVANGVLAGLLLLVLLKLLFAISADRRWERCSIAVIAYGEMPVAIYWGTYCHSTPHYSCSGVYTNEADGTRADSFLPAGTYVKMEVSEQEGERFVCQLLPEKIDLRWVAPFCGKRCALDEQHLNYRALRAAAKQINSKEKVVCFKILADQRVELSVGSSALIATEKIDPTAQQIVVQVYPPTWVEGEEDDTYGTYYREYQANRGAHHCGVRACRKGA